MKDKIEDSFKANTKISKRNGLFAVEGKKGLWGAYAKDKDVAMKQARHYFIQYYWDGEYEPCNTAS